MQTSHTSSNRLWAAPLILLQALALLSVGGLTLCAPNLYWNPTLYHSGDVWRYYTTAVGILQGHLPYRDFPLEYPPLAVAPFLMPLLLVGGHVVGFTTYCRLLLTENVILSAVFALTLAATARDLSPRRGNALAWYVLGIVILSPLLPWRYDLFPALLTLLSLRSVQCRRPALAGMWLGFGIAAKLYPVVFLPVLAAYYWVQKDRAATMRLLGTCLAATAASVLPFATAGPKLLSFLQYHQHRGIEIGSLAAGGIFVAHVLWRMPVLVVFNYGAFHLISPLSPVLLAIMPWAALALSGLTLLWTMRRFRADMDQTGAVRFETLIVSLTAMLLAFILTNKVFSPQYLIWFLPLVPLLARRQVLPFGAAFVLTILLFPFAFPALTMGEHWAIGLLVLRNLLMVSLFLSPLLPSRRVSLSSQPIFLPIIQGKKAMEQQP